MERGEGFSGSLSGLEENWYSVSNGGQTWSGGGVWEFVDYTDGPVFLKKQLMGLMWIVTGR